MPTINRTQNQPYLDRKAYAVQFIKTVINLIDRIGKFIQSFFYNTSKITDNRYKDRDLNKISSGKSTLYKLLSSNQIQKGLKKLPDLVPDILEGRKEINQLNLDELKSIRDELSTRNLTLTEDLMYLKEAIHARISQNEMLDIQQTIRNAQERETRVEERSVPQPVVTESIASVKEKAAVPRRVKKEKSSSKIADIAGEERPAGAPALPLFTPRQNRTENRAKN
jgi:hypothetical protein